MPARNADDRTRSVTWILVPGGHRSCSRLSVLGTLSEDKPCGALVTASCVVRSAPAAIQTPKRMRRHHEEKRHRGDGQPRVIRAVADRRGPHRPRRSDPAMVDGSPAPPCAGAAPTGTSRSALRPWGAGQASVAIWSGSVRPIFTAASLVAWSLPMAGAHIVICGSGDRATRWGARGPQGYFLSWPGRGFPRKSPGFPSGGCRRRFLTLSVPSTPITAQPARTCNGRSSTPPMGERPFHFS